MPGNAEWGEIPAGTEEFGIQKENTTVNKETGKRGWVSCPIPTGDGATVKRAAIANWEVVTDAAIVQAWGAGTYRIAWYGGGKSPKFTKHRGLSAPKQDAPAPAPRAAEPPHPAVASMIEGNKELQLFLLLEDRIARRYEGLFRQTQIDAQARVEEARAQAAASVAIAKAQMDAESKRQQSFYESLMKARKPDQDNEALDALREQIEDLEDKLEEKGGAAGETPIQIQNADGSFNAAGLAELFVKHSDKVVDAMTRVPDLLKLLSNKEKPTLPAGGSA